MARLKEGHRTKYSFAAAPSVALYQISVTPPGLDSGDWIENTTMDNTRYRTKVPPALAEITNGAMKVSYSPAALSDIIGLLGQNTLITVTFFTAEGWRIWGGLKSFKPDENQSGQQPTATCEIVFSCLNASDVEVAPVSF